MKRLFGPLDTLHIIVLTMIAMIFVALIVHHVANSTAGMKATHAYRVPANTSVSR